MDRPKFSRHHDEEEVPRPQALQIKNISSAIIDQPLPAGGRKKSREDYRLKNRVELTNRGKSHSISQRFLGTQDSKRGNSMNNTGGNKVFSKAGPKKSVEKPY